MRVYLVRHSLTLETGKRLSSQNSEISLSPTGVSLAAELGRSLAAIPLAAVYSSPHRRCVETAGAITRGRRIRPRIDQAFTEADYGRWLGRPLKSLYRLKAWQDLMTSPSRFRFPDGETLQEVQTRAVAGVEALAAKHPAEEIAVCSHGDIIRVILVHYLGIPLDLSHRIDPIPASVSVLDLSDRRMPRVPVVNYTVDGGRWR